MDVDLRLLLLVALAEPPALIDRVGVGTVTDLRGRIWQLKGGAQEVPTAEVERLRSWWPGLMKWWDR